ncbi:MAG: hypothetical protein D8M59_10465 [Planctomycetes bacterium]|nr:hypothetical protein [Planctomycetota bacterium]NOG55266.1 hypothetical protein [Planctomycetota bacterium]
MKRLTFWLAGILAFLVVLIVLSVVIFVLTGKSALRNKLAVWEEAGGAATMAEYAEKWNGQLTESEMQAGVAFANALAATPSENPEEISDNDLVGDEADTADLQALATCVEAAEEALALAHDAADADVTRWPIAVAESDSYMDMLGETVESLGNPRSLAKFLRIEAVYRARQGDMEGAFESIETGLRLAQYETRQPTLLSHLVAIAIQAIILDTIDTTMTQVTHPDTLPDLSSIDALLQRSMMRPHVRPVMLGEGTYGLSMYSDMAARSMPEVLSGILYGHVAARYLEYLLDGIEYYERQALQRTDANQPPIPPKWTGVSLLAPAIEKYNAAVTRCDAKTLLARQAIQLTEYYREHKAFPASEDFQSLATNEAHGFVITYTLSDDGHTVTLGCEPHPDFNTKEADAVSKETWELTW